MLNSNSDQCLRVTCRRINCYDFHLGRKVGLHFSPPSHSRCALCLSCTCVSRVASLAHTTQVQDVAPLASRYINIFKGPATAAVCLCTRILCRVVCTHMHTHTRHTYCVCTHDALYTIENETKERDTTAFGDDDDDRGS